MQGDDHGVLKNGREIFFAERVDIAMSVF